MAVIIPRPPDPIRRAFLDYVSRLQAERYRREQERAQEREAQQQRTITGVGLGLGAIGGVAIAGAMAPAAVASSAGYGALAAGTPVTATGAAAGLSTMGAISAGLTGASVGARMGQQFAGGDIAGGVTTAAQTAGGIMQSMQDKELFGYSPAPQERASYSQALAKTGYSMSEAATVVRETGSTIPAFIRSAQAAQADDERFQGMLTEAGWTGTVAEFDSLAERHPSKSRQGAYLDWLTQNAATQAQTAGLKAYRQKSANLQAEQDYYAGLAGNMKRKAIPREVNERDQRYADVEEMFRKGEIGVDQASAEIDKITASKPRVSYRPSEAPVTESWTKNFAIGQLPMPDGSMSPPFLMRRGRRTTENPEGEIQLEGWVKEHTGGSSGFADAMNELSLPQQMDLIAKAAQAALLGGDRDVTPTEAATRLVEDYNALQAAKRGAVARPGQPGAPGAQAPASAVSQRIAQSYGALSKMVSQKPVERWTAEEIEYSSQLVDKIILDVQQSGVKDQQTLEMLKQILEFKELINARRNRQP